MKRIGILMMLLIIASVFSVTTQVTTAQEEKQVFNISFGYETVVHFNPYAYGLFYTKICDFSHEPLALYLRNARKWIPELAVEWQITPNNFTVKLRQGVLWHDGTKFTSKDVIATFNLLWALGGGGITYGRTTIWDYLTDIKAPDDYTVIFYLKEPNTDVDWLTLKNYIQSYSVWSTVADKAADLRKRGATDVERTAMGNEVLNFRPEKMLGTGPWKVDRITQSLTVLKKWEKHRNADLIKFDEVHVNNIAAADVEFSLFIGGKLDQAGVAATPESILEVKKHPYLDVLSYQGGGGYGLLFNCKSYPLNIKEVRQAITYAINRPSVQAAAFPTYTYPTMQTILTLGMEKEYLGQEWMNKNINLYEYNKAKAEEIFAKLGFTKGADGVLVTPNGTRLELDLIGRAWMLKEMEALTSELAKVGVKVNARAIGGEFWTIVPSGEYAHLAIFLWGFEPTVYSALLGWFRPPSQVRFTEMVKKVTIPETVVPGLGEIDLKESVLKLPTTFDKEERSKIVKALSWVANEYMLCAPLWVETTYVGVNVERVTGWPESFDPVWYTSGLGPGHGTITYLLNTGVIRPKVPITYVTAYAVKDVAAFTGADGKTYGPYKAGAAMVIPKTDADGLIGKGMASYIPPTPPGLIETVDATRKAAERIETAVTALSKAVDAMSSLLYATIGLQVIVLIVVIVTMMATRKKPA